MLHCARSCGQGRRARHRRGGHARVRDDRRNSVRPSAGGSARRASSATARCATWRRSRACPTSPCSPATSRRADRSSAERGAVNCRLSFGGTIGHAGRPDPRRRRWPRCAVAGERAHAARGGRGEDRRRKWSGSPGWRRGRRSASCLGWERRLDFDSIDIRRRGREDIRAGNGGACKAATASLVVVGEFGLVARLEKVSMVFARDVRVRAQAALQVVSADLAKQRIERILRKAARLLRQPRRQVQKRNFGVEPGAKEECHGETILTRWRRHHPVHVGAQVAVGGDLEDLTDIDNE